MIYLLTEIGFSPGGRSTVYIYTQTIRRTISSTNFNAQFSLFINNMLSALNQCTVQTFTESEDTRCCVNTIFPPEDGHVNARNMSRIIV